MLFLVLLFKHMVIPKIVELEKQIIQFLQVNSFIFIDFICPGIHGQAFNPDQL